MKILLAPDSYKGSLTAVQVANALEEGIKRFLPDSEVVKVPMADGGEGTVEALVTATGGRIVPCRVTGPLGGPVDAFFGILGDGCTGVLEMAAASGLPLVPVEKRNPMVTTTYGTGELMVRAIEYGCRKLIIGIGGSATNDGGMGMAQALGVRFLDSDGRELGYGGGQLLQLHRIDAGNQYPGISQVDIQVACDVNNLLCGPKGAAAVYGPQKGATEDMVTRLDRGLARLAEVIVRDMGKDILELPGAGAAGGLGGGLVAFAGAVLRSGVEIVMEAVKLEQLVRDTDLVITGEGRTDAQTAYGKAPVGVARVAKKYEKPVICISGSLGAGAERVYKYGIDALASILVEPMTVEEAMARGKELLVKAGDGIARLIMAGVAINKRCVEKTGAN